jgi:hypothetical protein
MSSSMITARRRLLGEFGGIARTNAIRRPSGDQEAFPSYASGFCNCVSCCISCELRSSIQRPVRPFRSPLKTTRRPSGEKDGSRSSATSRTAFVIARALPPAEGISQSWPRRSITIDFPSGDKSNPRFVPSLTRIVMVSREPLAGTGIVEPEMKIRRNKAMGSRR